MLPAAPRQTAACCLPFPIGSGRIRWQTVVSWGAAVSAPDAPATPRPGDVCELRTPSGLAGTPATVVSVSGVTAVVVATLADEAGRRPFRLRVPLAALGTPRPPAAPARPPSA